MSWMKRLAIAAALAALAFTVAAQVQKPKEIRTFAIVMTGTGGPVEAKEVRTFPIVMTGVGGESGPKEIRTFPINMTGTRK